ncbi:transposase [Nonomuraea sp. NPDC004702]
MSVLNEAARVESFAALCRFRTDFYDCLSARADAVLRSDGPVRSLVELSLVGEHRRGHGSLYAALDRGRLEVGRPRRALSTVPLPRAADERLVLAVDVTCWPRPDAHTSPERILCHTYGRGEDQHIMIPGWPYSFVVALETGRSSWTAPLDALRLAPGDDLAAVTAAQLREVVGRLMADGHGQCGDPDILIVADAGYDGPRLAGRTWSGAHASSKPSPPTPPSTPSDVYSQPGRWPRRTGPGISARNCCTASPPIAPSTPPTECGRLGDSLTWARSSRAQGSLKPSLPTQPSSRTTECGQRRAWLKWTWSEALCSSKPSPPTAPSSPPTGYWLRGA